MDDFINIGNEENPVYLRASAIILVGGKDSTGRRSVLMASGTEVPLNDTQANIIVTQLSRNKGVSFPEF